MTSLPGQLLFPVLLATGLFAPGWLLGRALGLPGGLAGAFLGSAALLLNLVLALDAAGLRLDRLHLSLALALLCAGLAVLGRRPPGESGPGPAHPPESESGSKVRWWWRLPVAAALAPLGWRIVVEPLAGFDTYFRWDQLARQMVREGSLQFYPAVSAADFRLYGWCDGIAPLISTLHFWAYTSCGGINDLAIAPLVALEVVVGFVALHQLAALRAGRAAGAAAAILFALSSVALWGVAMAQETGLTALGLVAVFLFVEKHRAEPGRGWLAWAGVAAGTCALAREYGLAFIALGALAAARTRPTWRGWCRYLVPALLLALPWYGRNWLRTGSPLWSHRVLGLFPTHPVHDDHMRVVAELSGIGIAPGLLAFLLLTLAGIPLLAGLAGCLRRPAERAPDLLAIAVVTGLWLWSVGQTSGGYTYSMRVLTPALALGAVAGAPWLGGWLARRQGWILTATLTVLAFDAGMRAVFLPIEPHLAWWRTGAAAWDRKEHLRDDWRDSPNWKVLTAAAAGRDILVVDGSTQRRFAEEGARALSLFSPSVAFLFAPDARYADCLPRLRRLGVRFMLLPRNDAFFDLQFSRYPFFQALRAQPPAATLQPHVVYDFDLLAAAPQP